MSEFHFAVHGEKKHQKAKADLVVGKSPAASVRGIAGGDNAYCGHL